MTSFCMTSKGTARPQRWGNHFTYLKIQCPHFNLQCDHTEIRVTAFMWRITAKPYLSHTHTHTDFHTTTRSHIIHIINTWKQLLIGHCHFSSTAMIGFLMHSAFNSAARILFSRTPRPPDNREGERLAETLPAEVQGPWTLRGRCGSAVRAGTLRIQEVPGWRVGPPARALRIEWWRVRWAVQPRRSGSRLVPGPCRLRPLCQCPRSLRCDGCPCCTYCTHYQGQIHRTDGHREDPDHRQVRHPPV